MQAPVLLGAGMASAEESTRHKTGDFSSALDMVDAKALLQSDADLLVHPGDHVLIVVKAGENLTVHRIVRVDSEIWCEVEAAGQKGFVQGHHVQFRLLLNCAVRGPAADLYRRITAMVARDFDQELVWNALRQNRTYPHLTLKYDFEANAEQLLQLHEVIAGFVAGQQPLPLQFIGASAFGTSCVFLDVDQQPSGSDCSGVFLANLRKNLQEELEWMDWSKEEKGVHWHATVAMGWGDADSTSISSRILQAIRTQHSAEFPCSFQLGNITIMSKWPGPPEPYRSTAKQILTYEMRSG